MRKSILAVFFSLLILGALVLFGQRVSAQTATPAAAPQTETLGGATRSVNGLSPNAITSLPMSNPFCSQPDPSMNQCYVNVRYWQANDNGSGNILAYVEMSVNGKLRFRSNAFFENFITYSFDMVPDGIKVTCGAPNAGGYGTQYGLGYTIDVKAFDVTNTWVLDDQLLVKCPAFNP
jgi:hypothetical protein